MAGKCHFKYNWISGVETLEKYEPGGYHPVMVGDVLHGRYHVADKLGQGGYSTVWLAHDTYRKQYVALKVNVASSVPRESKVLKALSSSPLPPYLPELLDEFESEGLIPQPSLPLNVARALSYRLTKAVAYIHSRGYVHGDIHLSNVLLKLPSSFNGLSIQQLYDKYGKPDTVPITQCSGEPLSPSVPAEAVLPLFLGRSADKLTLREAHLLLSDFGEAFAPTSEIRHGRDCHTPPAFRAPEAKFEPDAPLTYPSDIWSLATAIWDIIGMKTMFSASWVTEDEVISQHIDVLGAMPSDWWLRWEGRSQFFLENGQSTEFHRRNKWLPLEETFEDCVQKWRRKKGIEIGKDEKEAFLNLMRRMLVFRLEERPTADEVLRSEWMVKWGLPNYEQSLDDPVCD